MEVCPPFLPGRRCGERIDAERLGRAWRHLRSVATRLDAIAKQEGWPRPFAPARYLILVLLERAPAHRLSARRLVRALAMSPSTLAHHLAVLERAGFIHRGPWTLYDRRKVAVRLTEAGRHVARRFTGG